MANTKCPAIYKNLGLETFGDKKKVTEEILKQFCKNDEWLRREVEEVRYLTPPAVRKSLKIGDTLDEDKSWGYSINAEKEVGFSNKTYDVIEIDLTNEEGLSRWYDDVKSSTSVYKPETDSSEFTRIQLPYTDDVVQEEIIKKFGTAEIYEAYNSAWYVGFDKSKPFYLKPKWIWGWKKKAMYDPVPAVARAQTFKVPDNHSGRLEQVDIQLEYNGTPTLSSSPLYVQIWDTYMGWINVTTWNEKTKVAEPQYETKTSHRLATGSNPPASWDTYDRIKKKVRYTSGAKKGQVKDVIISYVKNKNGNGNYILKRRKIAKPKSDGGKSVRYPLAEFVYNPQEGTIKGGEQSMSFTKPPKVKAGKSYAIVLLSPLNNWSNCPRWCGWGRNCNKDQLYNDGYAFMSTDNGISWKVYGKNEDLNKISTYKYGIWTPQDFRFRCYVKTQDEETERHYKTGRVMYLNPIYANPIYKVRLDPRDKGTDLTDVNNGLTITYQISTDGDNWDDFSENLVYNLSTPSRVIFIRAILETDNTLDTPYIEKLNVSLNMNLPTEMYVRTKPYTPDKFGTILGASLWGRVFAPYTLEDESSVDCKVDIIEMKENVEYFDIVDLELLDEKIIEKNIPNMDWIEQHETAKSRCQYLTDHPEILDEFKNKYKMYLRPYEIDDEMYNLSFAPSRDKLVVSALAEEYSDLEVDEETGLETGVKYNNYVDEIGGIHLTNEVAYPIINCLLEPETDDGGRLSTFGEWYDYTFDYQNNNLIFKRSTLDTMSSGLLAITYNPVFIKDLTNDEIGIHYDNETGLRSDGLVLDYFKETIGITEDMVNSKKVPLRVEAVDPIRAVYLYKINESEPYTLKENADYEYDIDTHELDFNIDYISSQPTIDMEGDVLVVVYTPNLDDTSICIGYNATRTNTNKQCTIEDYYIEYKV